MKLYSILFETKQQTNYGDPSSFALYISPDSRFVLVNIQQYINHITQGQNLPIPQYIAAYAYVKVKHTNNCSGAVEINYIASSPEYKGAGNTLRKIISKYFNKPITSDRQGYDSDLSKKSWS